MTVFAAVALSRVDFTGSLRISGYILFILMVFSITNTEVR